MDDRMYILRHFEKLAPVYDTIVSPILHSIRRECVERFGDEKRKILDVACGTGSQALLLGKAGHEVVGIDISKSMLDKARRKSKDVVFLEGDATHLPFRDGEFDAAIISFALHDMPEKIRVSTLKEMKRVTARGGILLIAEYNDSAGFFPRSFLFLSRLWETKYYWSFVRTGLPNYLRQAALIPKKRTTHLVGTVQIVECENS